MTLSQIEALIAVRADGGNNHVSSERNLWNALKNEIFKIGEVKEMDVSSAYIAANFDETGLGINLEVGFAICNGNNGTKNRGKRVSVGYDPTDYPTLGATGGNKTHQITEAEIPSKEITVNTSADDTGEETGTLFMVSTTNPTTTPTRTIQAAAEAVSELSLMQPYIVTLFIQRIA